MPFEWQGQINEAPVVSGASFHANGEPPIGELHLWPHRSLPKRGFAIFIGATFVLLLLPLFAVLGTKVWWGLLPFLLGTLAMMWALLQKSYRDGEILERLRLWSDRVELTRSKPGEDQKRWAATPYWIRVKLHRTGGPVQGYLTLSGADREVELGAFLSLEERETLYEELNTLIPRLASNALPGPV